MSMFVIAALGRGYLAPGETSWIPVKDDALIYSQRDAAEKALASLVHRKFAPDHAGVIQIDAPLPTPKTTKEQRQDAKAKADVKAAATTETAKVKKPSTKAPKAAHTDGATTLRDICAELKIDPSEARKTLRAGGERAPGGRWEWPAADVAKIKALLNQAFES